jgi:hypothetical protein
MVEDFELNNVPTNPDIKGEILKTIDKTEKTDFESKELIIPGTGNINTRQYKIHIPKKLADQAEFQKHEFKVIYTLDKSQNPPTLSAKFVKK